MVVLATDIFIFVYKPQTLGISDVKAGHGQHGSQQFASDEEASHVYEKVPFGDEREPGFLVGTQGKNWLVDTSDTNLLLVAPPKMGKTRRNFIPTLEYNARVNENTDGRGAGMILMDVKGTLYNKAGPELQAKGYCTPVLDLRNVFRSYQFNILYRVNKEIDAWRTSVNEEDRVKHYGAAERFAKVAANAIIANVQAHGSNENQFFIDTARGMITGFILLVAIYAPPTARHIISVFELIVQCSAPESLPVPGAPQRTMIASLMEHINDRRIRNYVAPASSADIRTALNIFSSALSHLLKFVDAEIPDQFVRQVNASLRLLEKRQNAKTNQVLSELAIQECILTFIIASNTNIPADALAMYRQKAVEFLRLNNRVFRMDESELI